MSNVTVTKRVRLATSPKQVTKRLLTSIPERARDIVTSRFGLDGKDGMTLESIGKKYKITRERVRQIENYAINHIRKSKAFADEKPFFAHLKDELAKVGGLVAEDHVMSHFYLDAEGKKQLSFLLTVGTEFVNLKENSNYKSRWHIDEKLTTKIEEAISKLYESLADDEIVPEADMVKNFLSHLTEVSDEYKTDEILTRYLTLSKNIAKNPLGEWGKAKSPNIRTKGIRDYAYLILRRHGSPIHFREVASLIESVFKKKAHIATTHNELIKDRRFVLVGRGLYSLREWGYSAGIVRDVISDIIRKNGPLTKKAIIDKVLRERYVKTNTIVVNLQNTRFFKKNADGLYTLVS